MSTRTAWLLFVMVIAASACNQRAGTLDTPVAPTTTSLTPPAGAVPPPPAPPISLGPLQPGDLATLNLTYSAIHAGDSQRGVVNVYRGAPPGGAPAGGVTISLSANNNAVIVPATVFVAPGEVTAEFTLTTLAVQDDRQTVITASAGGRTAIAALAIFAELPVYYTYTSEADEFFLEHAAVGRVPSCCADFSVTCNANEIRVDMKGPDPDTWTLTFRASPGAPLGVGTYEGVTQAPNGNASMVISGRDKSCRNSSGRFVIRELDLRNDRINRFRLSFEERCLDDRLQGLLRGEMRLTDVSCLR
jgi:hypothetical protein